MNDQPPAPPPLAPEPVPASAYAPPADGPAAPAPPHSRLGIASFVISVVVGALLFLLLVAAVLIAVKSGNPQHGLDEKSPLAIVLGLSLLACGVLDLVALGLGIAGCAQKDSRKVFAILGVVFSGLTVLGTVGLMVLGALAS